MTSRDELQTGRAAPPLVTRSDDDPSVLADAAIDDYALHVVPPTWRLNRIKLDIAWSATLAALFWVVIAAIGASIVGTKSALIGMAAALVFYTIISYPIQKAAADTGATLATFSRSIFGAVGVPIASLIFVISATVLAIFEGSVLAVAFHTHFGGNIYFWYGAVALFCTLITLGGVRVWLEKLNAWLLPVFLAGLIGALVWAIVKYGYQADWINAEAPDPSAFFGPGWLHVFALYLTGMVNVLYVFDFARMGRQRDVRYNGHVTFGVVYWVLAIMVIGGIGIYLSQAIPVDGVSEVGVVTGIVQLMGIWGVVYIFATQAKIQTANMYLSSLNLQIFVSRALKLNVSRTIWTFVVGVVLFAVMCADVFTFLTELLSYQGVLGTAWVAVALVHILYRRRGTPQQRFEMRPGRVPRINPGGLAGWVAGSVVGTAILATGSHFSLTYALIISGVVSAAVYSGSLFFAQPRWFKMERPYDPAQEVDADPWTVHIKCHHCGKSYVAVEMDRDPDNGHAAICSSCAGSHAFQQAARAESQLLLSKE
ncbi:MAG: thiamine permease [Gordonia sp.]|nr:thiamine permease [Gordonia sp. (in: high G+C Gram-positive bacteria)]